jgi:hypothetical protein
MRWAHQCGKTVIDLTQPADLLHPDEGCSKCGAIRTSGNNDQMDYPPRCSHCGKWPAECECYNAPDDVNAPKHYNQGPIECIDAIKQTLTPEQFRGYLTGNCQKYLWRHQYKNGLQDLRKLGWYLDRLIEEWEQPRG